ncbi:MAG: undecaprenyl-phosphate glucose phosphotransferase [Anaerolineae bacterium]|nr:undecaprenyl-phosphate glucose phosphotransferase [Anaerolineae bacterium]NIN95773.1 undecaprenyl-phosphate glucose phosphotransferase [Anaerolineae bacterium]NIQ78748.1 undecaprenyl-phosphate glucose phosphotransferase [Anaerolineae bacterium]
MKGKSRVLFAGFLVAIDILMVSVAFVFSYSLRLWTEHLSPADVGPLSDYAGILLIQILTLITIFFFSKLYHRQRAQSHIDEFYTIFVAVSVGTIMSVAFNSFILRNGPEYSRRLIVFNWALTIVLVTLGRLLYARLMWVLQSRGVGQARVLIVGTGETGRTILHAIQRSPGLGYEVAGMVSQDSQRQDLGVPVLGNTDELPSVIRAHNIDEVIIALPEAPSDVILPIISDCHRAKVATKVYPSVFQLITSDLSIGHLGGLPLLTVRDTVLRGWRLTLKRTMDVVVTGVGLIFLAPFMLLLAVVIKLDSPGRAFYTQERMGLDEKPFQMIKFRSMREGAEDETGPVWAIKEDPRRTRLGALIRRYSLDELPQLINVFIGEMSLVGPRPERPVFVEQFKQIVPRYVERHQEKAGMTGWAQVNGLRGDTSIVERTKYDLYYIENWSILFDIKILIKTLFTFFRDKAAA